MERWSYGRKSPNCGCVDGLNAASGDRDERGVPIWNAGSRVATATARAAETLSTQRSSKDFNTEETAEDHIEEKGEIRQRVSSRGNGESKFKTPA